MCAKHSAWSRWRPGRPTGPSGGSRGRRSAGAGCLPDSTGSGSPSEREAAPRGTMPVSSPATRLQPFLVSGYHGEPTRGSVTIQAFDREQRFRRAVAELGKWWGIGLLTVLIPVAHFVLVPSFLATPTGRPAGRPVNNKPDAHAVGLFLVHHLLQLLAGTERWGDRRLDLNYPARLGIAAHARRALAGFDRPAGVGLGHLGSHGQCRGQLGFVHGVSL